MNLISKTWKVRNTTYKSKHDSLVIHDNKLYKIMQIFVQEFYT